MQFLMGQDAGHMLKRTKKELNDPLTVCKWLQLQGGRTDENQKNGNRNGSGSFDSFNWCSGLCRGSD
jgi:hypothetical protein